MSYEKQNWVPYDDNLSEEENINVGAVVTAERMNHLESGIQQHTNDEENPHKVTKAQVGLSNVTDVEQASKVDFEAHATNNLNPHGVTASQVGLGNVENIRQAAKDSVYTKMESDEKYSTKIDVDSKISAVTKELSGELEEKTKEYTRSLTPSVGTLPEGRPFSVSRQGNQCILEIYITNIEGRNIAITNLPVGFRMPLNKNFTMKSVGVTSAYAWFESSTGNIIIGRAYDTSGERDLKKTDYFEVSLAYRTSDSVPEN